MNKLTDTLTILSAFYGSVDSKIHYDGSRLLNDKEFLESIDENNINLLEEKIKEEIARQNNILNMITDKDNISNCTIEDKENYFILEFSRPNYLYTHTKTYITDKEGKNILHPSGSKEIIPLDSDNFLQIEKIIKDENDIITTVLHYSLQEDEWKLIKTFKNIGISHLIPHNFNSNGTVYSQNVVGFRNLKDTNMLYNFKKQQVMIDDYNEASYELDTFDKDIYQNAIRISKYSASYRLDYIVNSEGQLISEFKIIDKEDVIIDQPNINESQRDYINRIIENYNNRPKNNRNKVLQKSSDSN